MGELTDIQGRFTAEVYLEILEEVMLPTVREMAFPFPERIVFMHDNSSIHSANIVKRWFREQRHVELFNFPSKIADLNPIENIWGCLVNAWDPEEERTKEQLMRHALTEWEVLRRKPEIVFNIVASMPQRLQSVIDHEGGWTKY